MKRYELCSQCGRYDSGPLANDKCECNIKQYTLIYRPPSDGELRELKALCPWIDDTWEITLGNSDGDEAAT